MPEPSIFGENDYQFLTIEQQNNFSKSTTFNVAIFEKETACNFSKTNTFNVLLFEKPNSKIGQRFLILIR